ncbi:pectate lyase-like protein [Roseiarcus fermentans]|uniref:Pectate lyase-like protein n=2 Tax=Roseiarcus fermentans TaxID=1473586 RepID=A0A366ET27_9HYPH|nr:pectate lyase-like protein [Roseiarcus fermentans]
MRKSLRLFAVIALATAFAAASQAARSESVSYRSAQDFQILADGKTDVGADLERAIATTARQGQGLLLPCGVYLVNSRSVALPSHARLKGSGACSIIREGPSLSNTQHAVPDPHGVTWKLVFTNDDWDHGNSDISIANVAFDIRAAPRGKGVTVAIMFTNASDVSLDQIDIEGGASKGARSDDGIAFVNSNHYRVANSRVTDIVNACYDNWGNSHDFVIDHNTCDGASNPWPVGILITGMNTDLTPAVIENANVTNNTIKNVGATGIWVEGGWNQKKGADATYGIVRNARIVGNLVEGVTRFHGIRVSDADNITISGNMVSGVAAAGFVSVTEYQGTQSNLTVTDNRFSDCNQQGGMYPCVQFEKTTHGALFEGNRIGGASYPYGVVVNPGSSNVRILGNSIEKGSRGTVGDAGTNDEVSNP